MSLQHCDWSAGTLARAANTCCKWLQQSEKSTLSPVSPTIITASLLSYYSPTLAHLHWLPHILVDAYFIWCLMLFSSAYFILEVAKTTSLYLGQAIIRADVPFDSYLDNTLRMLSESVNTSRLLVWLLSFESFVLVAFWKNRLLWCLYVFVQVCFCYRELSSSIVHVSEFLVVLFLLNFYSSYTWTRVCAFVQLYVCVCLSCRLGFLILVGRRELPRAVRLIRYVLLWMWKYLLNHMTRIPHCCNRCAVIKEGLSCLRAGWKVISSW